MDSPPSHTLLHSILKLSKTTFGRLCLKVACYPLSQTLTDPHMEHMKKPFERTSPLISLSVCQSNLLCLRPNHLKALPYLPALAVYFPSEIQPALAKVAQPIHQRVT